MARTSQRIDSAQRGCEMLLLHLLSMVEPLPLQDIFLLLRGTGEITASPLFHTGFLWCLHILFLRSVRKKPCALQTSTNAQTDHKSQPLAPSPSTRNCSIHNYILSNNPMLILVISRRCASVLVEQVVFSLSSAFLPTCPYRYCVRILL